MSGIDVSALIPHMERTGERAIERKENMLLDHCHSRTPCDDSIIARILAHKCHTIVATMGDHSCVA